MARRSHKNKKYSKEVKLRAVEEYKAEKKILEAKIKDLEMENALLKKLKELERGRR